MLKVGMSHLICGIRLSVSFFLSFFFFSIYLIRFIRRRQMDPREPRLAPPVAVVCLWLVPPSAAASRGEHHRSCYNQRPVKLLPRPTSPAARALFSSFLARVSSYFVPLISRMGCPNSVFQPNHFIPVPFPIQIQHKRTWCVQYMYTQYFVFENSKFVGTYHLYS